MKMNKSGNHTVGTSEGLVTGWVVDGGYPGTDLVTNANKLTLKAGTGKTIYVEVSYTGTNGFSRTMRIYKNGVQIDSRAQTNAPGQFSYNLPNQTFVDGDTIELRAFSQSTTSTITTTNTSIRIE